MKKHMALALSLVFCMFLAACSGPKTFNRLYETKNGSEQLEFFDDGTVEVYNDGVLITGTYEHVEKHTYKVRLNILFMQVRYTAVVDGDMITLTEDGNDSNFQKYYLVK